ncbi:hypothetical protein ASPCAL13061 [Aspergillus calidoustus]|uniref:Uncharacterized protein n=1 Tax=Aspergillus calidoustus TaxID=454130 RepID=A0A0U5GFR2_ASPCI|nr:hypothetical protein ASPCAL13061 [Aspergillus calidoustus]
MSLSRFCLRITFENSPISILAFLLKFKLKQALRRSCGVTVFPSLLTVGSCAAGTEEICDESLDQPLSSDPEEVGLKSRSSNFHDATRRLWMGRCTSPPTAHVCRCLELEKMGECLQA